MGVWAYSISAVKQDVFDDVDEEAKALQARASVPSSTTASTTTNTTTAAATPAPMTTADLVVPTPSMPLPPVEKKGPAPRGVLGSILGDRWPRVLDPQSGTLVWGAPSVDNIGRMGTRSS